MHTDNKLRGFLKSKLFFLLALFLGLIIVFTVWAKIINTRFLTLDTLLAIADSMIVTAFLAIGAGFLMVSGRLDLSVARSGMFAGMLLAVSIKYWDVPGTLGLIPGTMIIIVCGLLCCAVFGIINATLVNIFNFQPFIATMAMASVIDGITRIVSVDPVSGVATPVNASNAVTNFIGTARIGGIPFMYIFVIAAFIIYGLILAKTKFGMKMYLVGGNPKAARLCGINPRTVSYLLYINCAMLAGVSGVTLMCRVGQGGLESMAQYQFTGLTAAILGGVSFGGGSGNMGGVFVGILLLNTFTKGTTIVRFDPYWTNVLSGVLLLVALTLDYYTSRGTQKSAPEGFSRNPS